jgi:transposase-like protein
MVQVRDLTELTVKDLWREVKEEEDWWGDLKVETAKLVKRLLESAMDEEILEHVKVRRYERSDTRRGYRNGYRHRSLLTEFGLLDAIRVPRDREGGYRPGVLPRYCRRQRQVDRMVREMFLSGVSTRRVEEVVMPLLGEGISAQTVSRITRSLDHEVSLYHRRRLDDNYLYLVVDGITLKVKGATGVKKRLVLCAYGITALGQRELVSFRQASSESEAQWLAFLQDLYNRGLEGKRLRLVTTDGCPGLHNALEVVYPYAPRQRCWAHKLRNVASRLRRKDKEPCLDEAKGIYLSHTRREGVARYREWASRWQEIAPDAVACLGKDLEELLPFLDCPRSHWKKVRTTNAIERTFREVRRRTRPMSCFQNPASVDRIVYGVISHLNKNWKARPLPQFTHFT